ncbi:protein translocase subunit SecD [Aeromonas salmonicida]|uniref:Protein translocase subunit SecD n=1 Tax=Aeromonas salmonicida subsp. pectinolytica 34mel TaxID=1324960 RepID=T0PAJ1_AERSA|nr:MULTISPECIES: protein translocase subunit SecD [Aeromonas]MBP6384243.1 protein translocase subunit SecD [Aeromonas sp.]ATP09113.1 protein translocase subunit SecD [Aeromonas salmonicida subsp. pectinolytica 34mel]EQC04060.1 protein-export membrane protein SecD [Aeromonas salmonicida subsp. pectinolytica 34mel]KTA82692.1 preprotein translocase subunit SecD [Aeromonas salmonicida]MDE7526965.1 protein translocase subunit SecD [Aeromonas salmonicida]
MLNRYPLWKYLMVVFVIAIGFLYAAPNLYGEDPALQVSASRGAEVKLDTLDLVKETLEAASIPVKHAAFEHGLILVRFQNTEDQLKARDLVANKLGDNFITALNLAPSTPAWLEAIGAAPLKLGLDLRGGVHFLMEVDMAEALTKQQEQMVQDFRTELRTQKIRYSGVRRVGDQVQVLFRDEADQERAVSYLRRQNPDLTFTTEQKGDEFVLNAALSDAKIKEVRKYALEQNITIIRNRVNELGVAEPLVQQQGAERIVVQLPGIQDTARAKEILGATATLEFHMVDETADIQAAADGRVPPSSKVYNDRNGRPVVLQKRVILTGDHIVGAQSGFDEYSRPQVNIKLDGQGGNKMANFTKDNVGKGMATVFIEYKPVGQPGPDGKRKFRKQEEVINVATIQSRLGSQFRITGIDNANEAHNLALLLRAGALIAPIQIVEERTIGPSLGQQNIDSGMEAIGWAMLVIVLFMGIYYRAFGWVANLALTMNLVLIVGIMSMIPGATMTLPGIAGIVLTLGMAVDANVLIYERIREEIRNGRGVQQAIHLGFDRAFSTIADSNVTSLITCVILFGIGTGAIKGFALTLGIGLSASMFTAITVSRAIINLGWGGRRIDKLPI